MTDDETIFDVREIPCQIKHPQIMQRFFGLPVGAFFVLVNDHDPVPCITNSTPFFQRLSGGNTSNAAPRTSASS